MRRGGCDGRNSRSKSCVGGRWECGNWDDEDDGPCERGLRTGSDRDSIEIRSRLESSCQFRKDCGVLTLHI